MCFRCLGSDSYLFLLNTISNCSALWWKVWSMQFLDTSRKPNARSDEAPLNSAPPSRPRSNAGTISPPGRALTAAPMTLYMSMARPTVRNFRPLTSSALVTGFLNQPNGWVGMGPYIIDTTLTPMAFWISVSSSLPPPYSCQASSMLASMPNDGPEPHSATAVFLPYQYATPPWPPSSVPADTASSRSNALTTAPAGSTSILSWPSAMSLTLRA